MERKKPPRRWIWYFSLISALIIVYKLCDNLSGVVKAIGFFIGILTPFVIGILLAALLHRPSLWLEKQIARGKGRFWKITARPLAIAIVYLLLFGLIALLLALILPHLADSLTELIMSLPTYFDAAVAEIEAFAQSGSFSALNLTEAFNKLYLTFTNTIMQLISTENLLTALRSVLSATMSIVDVIIGIIVSIYVLAGREHIVRALQSIAGLFVSKRRVARISHYTRRSMAIFCNYFYGALLDALVVGVIASVGLAFFKIPYAALLGFSLGLLNMIPYFGALIGGIGIVLVALLTNGIYAAVGVAIFIVVTQQIDANIIQPRVVGDSVGLRPIYVLLAITLFGGLFGFWGIFLGVPLMAIIQMFVKDAVAGKIGTHFTRLKSKLTQKTPNESASQPTNNPSEATADDHP